MDSLKNDKYPDFNKLGMKEADIINKSLSEIKNNIKKETESQAPKDENILFFNTIKRTDSILDTFKQSEIKNDDIKKITEIN